MSDRLAEAQEREEWARKNPDDPEATDALLDAAGEWSAFGDHERALALYQEVQSEDRSGFGFVGAYITEELFALGREVEARAVITQTRVMLDTADQPDGDGYGSMADLLDERGETAAALEWCEAGIARYCPDYRPDAVGEDGYDATSAHLVSGRRMLREQLDLAPDALDVAVDAAGQRVLQLLNKFAAAASGDHSSGRPREGMPIGMSMYWSKEDFAIVRARWPEIAVDYGEDYPAYCLRVEGVNRTLSAAGHPRIVLVRDSLAGYERYAQRLGLAPEDPLTRDGYARWLAGQHPDDAVAWPPPRNGRCWCGSGAKYKKCCGSTARQ